MINGLNLQRGFEPLSVEESEAIDRAVRERYPYPLASASQTCWTVRQNRWRACRS